MKNWKKYWKANRKFYMYVSIFSVLLCLLCQYVAWSVGQINHRENTEQTKNYSIRFYDEFLPERIAENKEAVKKDPNDTIAQNILEADLEYYANMEKHIEKLRDGKEWVGEDILSTNPINNWLIYQGWQPKTILEARSLEWRNNISQDMECYLYCYTFWLLAAFMLVVLAAQSFIRGRMTQEFYAQMPISRRERFFFEYFSGLLSMTGAWLATFLLCNVFYVLQGARPAELWVASLYACFYASFFYTFVYVIKDFFTMPAVGVAAGVIIASRLPEFLVEDFLKSKIFHYAGKNLLYAVPMVLVMTALLLVIGAYKARKIRFPRSGVTDGAGIKIFLSVFCARMVAGLMDGRDATMHVGLGVYVYNIANWEIWKYVVFAVFILVFGLLFFHREIFGEKRIPGAVSPAGRK